MPQLRNCYSTNGTIKSTYTPSPWHQAAQQRSGPSLSLARAGQAMESGWSALTSNARLLHLWRAHLCHSVLAYHGFHSAGSGATMPSRASHISSGSLMGSIPISLANSRISARRSRRVEKGSGKVDEKKNKSQSTCEILRNIYASSS